MPKILFLLAAEEAAEYAKTVLHEEFPEIFVDWCAPCDAMQPVTDYATKGVGVICSRGGISHVLRQAKTDMAQVEIPITAFEIIRAINKTKRYGKIAIIAHAEMTIGVDFLAASIGGEVRRYSVTYNQDYEKTVLQAVGDGAGAIVGGVLACAACKKHNIPFSLIDYGRDSLLQAAREAVRVCNALAAKAAKRHLLNTVIENFGDGIIIVDAFREITEANNAAEKLLKKSRLSLVGKDIASAIPQLAPSLEAGQSSGGGQSIVSIGRNKVVCLTEPILYNGKNYGAVFILRKTSSIQQMEAIVRKELYARGHVAKYHFSDILGKSAELRETVAMAKDFSRTNSCVLILGETGTGKEVFAQSIHNASTRANGPFVAVNCAAIPIHLLESELFGYVGGAFTGANKEGKPGLLEVAHGGTIFLDEMAEMDYANQSRLLRFLQEQAVVRLGSHIVIPVDVRVIAATNKNLEELVELNEFRDDLYFRLNVLQLELPPLRYRRGDVLLYANYFLRQFADESGKSLRLSPDAENALERYTWPGNIRECRNIMERLVARFESGVVTGAMLQPILSPLRKYAKPANTRVNRQKQEILDALDRTSGNYGETAKILEVNRSTLYRRMKRYGIA